MNIRNAANALGALLVVAYAMLAPVRNASAADTPAKVVRVGFLGSGATRPGITSTIVQELQRFGYVEGKNLVVEYLQAEAAAELTKLNVDVIVALTNPNAFAAQRATRAISIVVWGAHGAIETALVSSLPRPGGNLTGTKSLAPELDAKRMELLKQILSGLARVAVLYDAGDQGSTAHLKSTQAAGRASEWIRADDPSLDAKALGLTVPQAVLVRAEEVIQ